jgi:putative DNA primase/helicase
MRDHTPLWDRLTPIGIADDDARAAVARFCEGKRISFGALEQLGTRIKRHHDLGYCLVYAGSNGNGSIVAIKYRPLNGTSHDSFAEPRSVWLRPIVIGNPSSLDWLIAEGETDGARLYDLVGDRCAILILPAGARTFKPEWAALIPRGANVALCHDADADGDAGALKAAGIIGGHTVRVRPPIEGVDWCEWDGGREAFVGLVGKVGAASGGPSSLVCFSDITAVPVRWLWPDRIPFGKITALAGRPKIGKGLLYARLIADVTRGSIDGALREPRHAIIITTEDDPGDTLKPRLLAAGADLPHVHMFQMGSRDEPVPFRIPQDVDELSRRIEQTHAALVVVDPLIEFIDAKTDVHKSQPVRQALAALNSVARGTGIAILVIIHLNKGASTDPLVRHEASAAFTQVLRGAMLLGPDPADPKGERGDRRVLAMTSSNLARLAPSLAYEIHTRTVEGDNGEPITTADITCTGESLATGDELLARARDGDQDHSAVEEAGEFLRHELSNGPKPAEQLFALARGVGISQISLRRAKKTLDIASLKRGKDGPWEWDLPRRSSTNDHLPNDAVDHLRESPTPTGDSEERTLEGDHIQENDHLRAHEPPSAGRETPCTPPPSRQSGRYLGGAMTAPACCCPQPRLTKDDICLSCGGFRRTPPAETVSKVVGPELDELRRQFDDSTVGERA